MQTPHRILAPLLIPSIASLWLSTFCAVDLAYHHDHHHAPACTIRRGHGWLAGWHCLSERATATGVAALRRVCASASASASASPRLALVCLFCLRSDPRRQTPSLRQPDCPPRPLTLALSHPPRPASSSAASFLPFLPFLHRKSQPPKSHSRTYSRSRTYTHSHRPRLPTTTTTTIPQLTYTNIALTHTAHPKVTDSLVHRSRSSSPNDTPPQPSSLPFSLNRNTSRRGYGTPFSSPLRRRQ